MEMPTTISNCYALGQKPRQTREVIRDYDNAIVAFLRALDILDHKYHVFGRVQILNSEVTEFGQPTSMFVRSGKIEALIWQD